ncbi:MAG: hypothetical protein EPN37_10150 [Chitinophagaceae bacterium]|nr:MAG: hypothetical protein EPN37_10150 [Chitinophagaceae bacterium]
MNQTFSKRYGFHSQKEKEITIREDAPRELRGFIRMAFYDLNKKPSDLRSITTNVLKIPPDRDNWSEYPNIDDEAADHIDNCDWYKVYDIIEAIIRKLNIQQQETFTEELNDYFVENGIGWKIVDGHIETRGNKVFETAVETVATVLETAKLQTANNEIKEALKDLSRRPSPDITRAIQHSLACLECVAREVSGDKKATLGEIIKKHPNIVPKPLDAAIEKVWGFTSEQGRHLREGNAPEYLEAELVVQLTATISTYLGKKIGGTIKESENEELPF